MLRKEIRYKLFRLKTEAEGGAKAPEMDKGFKKSFEAQKKFQGWMSFGVTWDIGGRTPNEENPTIDATTTEESHWTVVLRDVSLDDAWNEVLSKVVVELTEESLVGE